MSSVLVRPWRLPRSCATAHRRPPPVPVSSSRFRSRRPTFSTLPALANNRRPQNFGSGFTSSFDPSQDSGRGPIFAKAPFGVPQFYPRDLKRQVDDYVVGQDRAKKTICSVIFNHYQGLRRRQHHEVEDQRLREKLQRQKHAQDRDLHERSGDYSANINNNPFPPNVESRQRPFNRSPRSSLRYWADGQLDSKDEFPDQNEATVERGASVSPDQSEDLWFAEEPQASKRVKIDKSNILLIGPTGVGKTYILETLSKKLKVPFTISDCNSFTQAGYIGQDVEACVERLLIDADYNLKAAEHGIIVLDEFDKIAKRETVNGRDVSGEGVQQALLKLVEGTKVTINVKDNRSSRTTSTANNSHPPAQSGKVDQYTIDTTNILFVFCGAFVGLDKAILRRVAKPSIGFGSEIRPVGGFSMSGSKFILPPELYSHLPHQPEQAEQTPFSSTLAPSLPSGAGGFTPLDLTTPADLQAFGFIPELIGRLHNICALTPLSLNELYRILTEPRNSLLAQYQALFDTYPSNLFFTERALYAIAERAIKNETGARGLKMEMERVLAEPMFEAPTHYVLITEGCVHGREKAYYWGKDGKMELERRMEEENGRTLEPEVTFEQFREAGQSGA